MINVGIITFHNSYNCGSMLESYAMQEIVKKIGANPEIIDFSSMGQRKMYSVFYDNTNLKDIVKNVLIFPRRKQIQENNQNYEYFKRHYSLSKQYREGKLVTDDSYDIVIAGSDQIWNITIPDYDDVYFLPWVKTAKKVAYAPSFGAKRIEDFSTDKEKYAIWIRAFDALSVREKNGKQWIKELSGKDAKLLIDPTLLLDLEDYSKIEEDIEIEKNSSFIFLYCPSFDKSICKMVQLLAEKYKLSVYTWSAKSYCIRNVKKYGFKLVASESPGKYLSYIRRAKLVITTSFHGTIFSTIYKKNFFVIKNGEMFGRDDRVKTLIEQLQIEDRMIPPVFDAAYDYMQVVDYTAYNKQLPILRMEAINYLKSEIIE